MKKKSRPALICLEPSEDDIRAYAFHLYEQNGCRLGCDSENWHEAKACLLASIPTHESHNRLHRHLHLQPVKTEALTGSRS